MSECTKEDCKCTKGTVLHLDDGDSVLKFDPDGGLELFIPGKPGQELVSNGAIVASAVACRLTADEDWGIELMEWYFEEIKKVEGEEDVPSDT